MKLMEYLPDYYKNSNEVMQIQDAIEVQEDVLSADTNKLLEQVFVDTADYAIDLWEDMLGIAKDNSKPLADRRARIKSKLRGQGTTTVALLKNIAESFVNGKIDIIEHNDEYRFDVKMVDKVGIPPNMDDLKTAIEEAKPAHLAYSIIILYNIHEELKKFTHEGLQSYTHGQIREEVLENG